MNRESVQYGKGETDQMRDLLLCSIFSDLNLQNVSLFFRVGYNVKKKLQGIDVYKVRYRSIVLYTSGPCNVLYSSHYMYVRMLL